MAKYQITKGATSQIFQIFVADSSSTTGGGLTGLTNATSGLTAYYHRDTDTTATAISLVTMTVGTFTSSGFKEIDATNMPGWYQFCPPNAALASGAANVGFHLKGATNMAPLPIEVQLSAFDIQDGVHGGLTCLPNTAVTTNASLLTSGTGTDQLSVASGRIDIGKALGTAVTLDTNNVLNVSTKYLAGTALTGRDIGASVLLSSGTGTGQLDFTSGVTKANATQWLSGTIPAVNVTGVPLVDLKYTLGTISPATAGSVRADAVTGAVGSVTAGVTVTTNNDKTGYSLTAGQLFIKKNTQFTLTFPMTDSTTHAPATGLTVASKRSIDGGALGNTANSVTELSAGLYSLVVAAADVNGAMITFNFTSAGADSKFIGVVTQA